MKNYYSTLGLSNYASVNDIRRAYRKLALVHHPDRGGNAERMKEINEAHDHLMKHKDIYDAQLRPRLPRNINGFTIIVGGSAWESANVTDTSFTYSF